MVRLFVLRLFDRLRLLAGKELLALTHPPGGTDARRITKGWKVGVRSELHNPAIRCVWCR